MNFTSIKSELYNFTDKLYNELIEGLKECSNIKEINELLDEEYTNLMDYKKILKFNAISHIKEELMNKTYGSEAIKKAVELQDRVRDIDISSLIINEEEVYIKEEIVALDEDEIRENKHAKSIIVTLGILAGIACGAIIKRGILDAMIMGLIGALAGYSIYEITLGKNNNNFQKVVIKDRKINRRLNRDYLNNLIHERKVLVEGMFLDYISKFNDLAQKLDK